MHHFLKVMKLMSAVSHPHHTHVDSAPLPPPAVPDHGPESDLSHLEVVLHGLTEPLPHPSFFWGGNPKLYIIIGGLWNRTFVPHLGHVFLG